MDHIHYAYTQDEINRMSPQERKRYEMFSKLDPNFYEIITPHDAGLITGYKSLTESISDGKYSNRLAVLGVTSLDPVTMDIIGTTKFYARKLSNTPDDAKDFKYLYKVVEQTSDETEIKDYTQLVREYSKGMPDFEYSRTS